MGAIGTALVVITVFYECLCPDSQSFIQHQMLPVMEKLNQYLSVELIPYGKAHTIETDEGTYTFKCQHGAKECLGNKIHACAIKRAPNDLIRVKVVTCMIINNYIPDEIGQTCCEKYNISWKSVESCAHGSEGVQLLKEQGDYTNELNPPISFVPTVLINKDRSNQRRILKNLLLEVCATLKKVSPTPIPECGDEPSSVEERSLCSN
ncbi:hypothetical protein O3M35_003907 [Rhynocoris fuscipes]|uniref:Gamma-interferon-inducible lysosomal thiol reductase n=1 Tax=Rhynocoris fuscipes TaxID=488301 RepID=A0AAW1CIW7_9HEMI